jgi:DNA polymerase/3'-5' exonuclease PolX
MGFCRLNNNTPIRRLDIRFIPYESYYYAQLYFTGPKDFNRKMRQVALDMGYTLNEYGLYDEKGKSFVVKSEKEIFELLNMEYLSPNLRK